MRIKLTNQGSLEAVVSGYMQSIVQAVVQRVNATTHGHAQGVHERKPGEVEGDIIARAGDTIHTFKVSLSLDGMNIIGVASYKSLSPAGQKARDQSKAFELPATAHPGHFADQMVAFCVDQFQGHSARPSVEWTLASVISKEAV